MENFKMFSLSTLRILFFIYNLMLMLIGFAYIGIGSWLISVLFTKPNFGFINLYYTSMGAIMITVGIFATILAFYGYALSTKRNVNKAIGYLIASILIMLFGVAVGVVGLTYASYTASQTSGIVSFAYFNSTQNSANVADIQIKYGCCGIDSITDWTLMGQTPTPFSCCSPYTGQPTCTTYYQSGCYNIVKNSISIDMSTSGGISLGIAMPMLIGIAFSIGLIFELRREEDDNNIKYKITT